MIDLPGFIFAEILGALVALRAGCWPGRSPSLPLQNSSSSQIGMELDFHRRIWDRLSDLDELAHHGVIAGYTARLTPAVSRRCSRKARTAGLVRRLDGHSAVMLSRSTAKSPSTKASSPRAT